MGLDITGIGSIAEFAGKVLDRVLPDQATKDAANLELFKAQQAGEFKVLDQQFALMQSQIGVNLEEAKSADPFTSRWRPFVGWSCGFALAYASIIDPMARFVATVMFHYNGPFPQIDTSVTLQVLLGLLGLGGLRTAEKIKGVAK
jgi:hypothetical protein